MQSDDSVTEKYLAVLTFGISHLHHEKLRNYRSFYA